MSETRATVRIDVDGMTCGNCEQRIEKAVGKLGGVWKVSASAALSEVTVVYEPDEVTLEAVSAAIREAGYAVRGDSPAPKSGACAGEEAAPSMAPAKATAAPLYRFLGLLAIVAALYLVLRYAVGFTFLPTVSQSMGYGLIFLVGLVTSLHCIAMCGGIVLSQGIARDAGLGYAQPPAGSGRLAARILPNLLYNGGRVVSYTVIGGAVGAVGSLFSLSAALKGVMPILAGAFMLFLGVRMLGVFPWLSRLKVRIPGVKSGRLSAAASRRGPLVVGLLNGLMPCGPLQTMQVYALGTGSLFAGALSMFLFSLGTVPLLLGLGAVSSLLSAKFTRRMLKASGVLVLALGLLMFSRGMTLFGVSLPGIGTRGTVAVAQVRGGIQEVTTTVDSGEYHPFIVQNGIPVRWTITARAEDLNGCNNPLTVPQYGIRAQLVPGRNVIEFTPRSEGTITYTCWMGMISSTIRVVPDLASLTAADLKAPDPQQAGIASAFDAGSLPAATAGTGGCCSGATTGAFAGGKVPTDLIVPARLESGAQVAEVKVDDAGYSPAVIVLQKGVKAKFRFVPAKLTSCNSVVDFPAYNGSLDLGAGQLETPYLDVQGDFTFQCGMGMLHGYVKVVDDISKVDMRAVKAAVDSYRASPTGIGGCCGS